MYDRCHLGISADKLKELLFVMSIAVGSFKNGGETDTHNDIDEIILLYDNVEGNVSISVRTADLKGFYPNVFVGLKDIFKTEVYFFFCFEAVFGCNMASTLLGSIPSLPNLSRMCSSGHFSVTLLECVRYALIDQRRKGLLTKIALGVLDVNVATFTFLFFLPLLMNFDARLPPMETMSKEFEKYISMRSDKFTRRKAFSFLKNAFIPLMKRKVPLNATQVSIARYLSYSCIDYHDAVQ